MFAAPKQARRKHKSRAQRSQRAAALRVDPQVELLRLRKMKALRSKLTRLCSKHKLRMPVLAFERWLSRCKLHERWAGDQHCDPLIPSTGWRDKGLVKDLKRVLASEEIAKEISAAMSDAALVASEEVATAAKAAARGEQVYATNANKASKATSDGTDDGSDVDSGDAAKSTEGPLEVVVVERGHTLALSLGEGNKQRLMYALVRENQRLVELLPLDGVLRHNRLEPVVRLGPAQPEELLARAAEMLLHVQDEEAHVYN